MRFCSALLMMALTLSSVAPILLSPSAAFAQGDEYEQALEEAMDDYDVLEIGAAEEKLANAIEKATAEGVSGEILGKLYVMLGVVRFAESRDEAVVTDLFIKGLQADPAVTIPDVYRTPELGELMQAAQEQAGVDPVEKSDDKPSVGITHQPLTDVDANEPIVFEAFVPTDMPVYRMFVYFRVMGETQWKKVEMQPTNAERFAVKVEGDEFHSSQFDYYIRAQDRAGTVIGNAGTPSEPLNVVVLGSSGEKKDDGDGDGDGDGNGKEKPPREPSDSIVYVSLLGGTSPGFLTGAENNQPTANPTHPVTPGLAIAFGHALLDAGVTISNKMQIGIFFRYQFSPFQDFGPLANSPTAAPGNGFWDTKEECLGLGLPGDCILGLRYKLFVNDSERVRIYSSVGTGVGRVRNWLRLRQAVNAEGGQARCADQQTEFTTVQGEQIEFCFVRDTVRVGWFHFGVGGGVAVPINDLMSLAFDGYLMVLAPNTGVNLDLSGGFQFNF